MKLRLITGALGDIRRGVCAENHLHWICFRCGQERIGKLIVGIWVGNGSNQAALKRCPNEITDAERAVWALQT